MGARRRPLRVTGEDRLGAGAWRALAFAGARALMGWKGGHAMRYGPDDTFWMVVDPTRDSVMADICFQTTLLGLELQFKGGLTAAQNTTMFTDEHEAKQEVQGRLAAMRAAALLRGGREDPKMPMEKMAIYGAGGEPVIETSLSDGDRS